MNETEAASPHGDSRVPARGVRARLLLRLAMLAGVVALAQATAPEAERWLRELAWAGEGMLALTALTVGTALLGPLAAGEALADWGGAAAPLLRAVPMLVACALMAATGYGLRRLILWSCRLAGSRSLRELLLGLPPLPRERTGRLRQLAGELVGGTVAGAVMLWLVMVQVALIGLAVRMDTDLTVGNVVWRVEDAASAVTTALVWALPLGVGWPALLLDLLLHLLLYLPPVVIPAVAVVWFWMIFRARRRWWRERQAPGGEGVHLSRGQAEAWLEERRELPRLLLRLRYGGEEGVRALDRAAAEALAKEAVEAAS